MKCSADCTFVFLFQAQALLAKNIFYQKIDLALKQLTCLQPAVYNNVPRTTTDAGVVSANHRDAVVSNLRLLNIFCNNSPVTFARAVSLLDRLLGQVKVSTFYYMVRGSSHRLICAFDEFCGLQSTL